RVEFERLWLWRAHDWWQINLYGRLQDTTQPARNRRAYAVAAGVAQKSRAIRRIGEPVEALRSWGSVDERVSTDESSGMRLVRACTQVYQPGPGVDLFASEPERTRES